MPDVTVSITAHQHTFVETEVQGGGYRDVSDVVRAALRLLEEQNQERAARVRDVRAAIDEGENSGEAVPLEDIETFLQRARARREARSRPMEPCSHYRQVMTRVLRNLTEASARDTIETLPLFDTTHDTYLVLDVGWDGIQRIHHIIAHLRLHNGKIWVEADTTDQEIVQQLLNAGIPKEAIVLAFYSPQKRPFTAFAVA
ncbi:MAG: type II toxin-antitoxin system ParD family antitoxin [Blastochloris sp.]|nr:type II toxin-antitoxin system ParD family antitoxin [Blastochloris sp.]